MNSSQSTPKELVEIFSSVDHKEFDQDNSLADFANKQSNKYFCPYSAESTGKGRSVQVYRYKFGGRVSGKSFKENYPSFVKFYLYGDQIRLINEQQKLFILPGQIISNLDITVNSNIFYEVRRDTIKEMKKEDLE